MLKPLGDRLVLEVQEQQEETVGGIVLASNAKEKPQIGVVKAAGAGERLANGEVAPMTVKVGDKVLFDKYAGTQVSYEGQKFLVVHEKDLLAIVE